MAYFAPILGLTITHYNENLDPSDLTKCFYSPAIPENPYLHEIKISNRHKFVSYDHALRPILTSDSVFYDFPFSLTIYIGEIGRQRVYLNDVHTLIALYNHSDFLKMHFHNAWLLGRTEITIVLPEELFHDSNHLFAFCGSYPIFNLCHHGDVSLFDFDLFLFAASYLMIHDDFLLSILHNLPITTFEQNSTVLRAFYMLNTLELNYPLTSCWFLCKFPYVDTTFFTSTFRHPYQTYRRHMLNFQCHNVRYHQHFYHRWLGHGHCLRPCEICSAMDSESSSTVARTINYLKLSDSLDIFHIPSILDPFLDTVHVCTLKCVPANYISKTKPNIFSVVMRKATIWQYYNNLTPNSQRLFKICHVIHNDINRNCLKILLEALSPIYSEMTIRHYILPSLSVTQKKMVIEKLLPIAVSAYTSFGYMTCESLPPIYFFFPEPLESLKSKYPNCYLPNMGFSVV